MKVAALKLYAWKLRLEQSTGLFLRRDDPLAYLENQVTRTKTSLLR